MRPHWVGEVAPLRRGAAWGIKLLQLWLLLIIPMISSHETLKRALFWGSAAAVLFVEVWGPRSDPSVSVEPVENTNWEVYKQQIVHYFSLFGCEAFCLLVSNCANNPKYSQVFSSDCGSNSISMYAFDFNIMLVTTQSPGKNVLFIYVDRNQEKFVFQHFKCCKSTFQIYIECQQFKNMLITNFSK